MIKQYALGLFEISIFMKDGVSRFGYQLKNFWQSFIVLGLTLPFTLASVPYVYRAEEGLQSLSLNVITALFALKFFFSMGLVVGFSYIICHVLQKVNKFLKYVTVSNWATLIPLLLYIPFLYMMSQGSQEYDGVYSFLVLISLYSYAIGAFITKYILEIPWELAIFITICSMAISEGCYKLLFFIANMA